MKPVLTYLGSVKSVYSLGSDNLFEFSDRYSIFDWGEMPDHLSRKGEALAVMGALFFEVMEKNGVHHHFISLTDKEGKELKGLVPTPFMKVKNVPVVRPALRTDGTYDYSHYQTKPKAGLVPLEVMFRFGISKGSSLLKRAQQAPALLTQWNLGPLHEGMRFEEPIIDFSTKLEKGDRYLTHKEAKEVAGLNDIEFARLVELNKKVALVLKGLFKEINIELWDGKTEWAFTAERDFVLVDTIGLDELRLEVGGEQLSKEFLRQHYKNTPWYTELEAAKKKTANFKDIVAPPAKLPPAVKYRAESLYLFFTNELSFLLNGTRPFGEEHTLEKWLELKS